MCYVRSASGVTVRVPAFECEPRGGCGANGPLSFFVSFAFGIVFVVATLVCLRRCTDRRPHRVHGARESTVVVQRSYPMRSGAPLRPWVVTNCDDSTVSPLTVAGTVVVEPGVGGDGGGPTVAADAVAQELLPHHVGLPMAVATPMPAGGGSTQTVGIDSGGTLCRPRYPRLQKIAIVASVLLMLVFFLSI